MKCEKYLSLLCRIL